MSTNTIQFTETQRYDRQIRVWGAEAQSRIQNARVLICGLHHLNPEVVKNLVLAGVNVTLQDSSVTQENDFSNNFFLSPTDIGKNIIDAMLPKIQELNLFVKIGTNKSPVSELTKDYLEQFDVIVLSGGEEAEAVRINDICHNHKPKSIVFFWNDVFGQDAIFYSDFGNSFTYKNDPKVSNQGGEQPTPAVNKENEFHTVNFPTLSKILKESWLSMPSRHFPLNKVFVKSRTLHRFRSKYHRNPKITDFPLVHRFYEQLAMESGIDTHDPPNQPLILPGFLNESDLLCICEQSALATVTTSSILGSILSQEIIKAISCVGQPGCNVFVFSGDELVAKAIPIGVSI